jgi:glyoxylase-like metal-dependent hydrolase (beta-lactamase superfamily II)
MTPAGSLIHPVRIPFIVLAPTGAVARTVTVFLICTPGGITLIDCGVAGSEKAIFAYLRKSGRKPDDISLVILTHSHPDHIGAAQAIRESAGAASAAHAGEQPWIEDIRLQEQERPVPGFRELVGGPVRVDRELTDGESIPLTAGQSLEVIHTPGHSPGSISLLHRPSMALFSGDAIPVPGDLPIYDDPVASIRSMGKLMAVPGIQALYPAWADPVRGDAVYPALESGLSYLHQVHEAVREAVLADPAISPLLLTRTVMAAIGIPPEKANPMVVRSLLAHVRARDRIP